MTIYRSMLFLHWKQVRMALIPFVIASFGLPLIAVDGLGAPPGMDVASLEAYRLVLGNQAVMPLFPLLAGAIGVTLALFAWNWDHQLDHVYALSLPISRWEYTVAKMVAGVLLILVPVAGMWLGNHVAAASLSLPTGLHAYPDQLTVRFFFAILLAYALFFALAAGTVRTTMWVLGGAVALVVLGAVVNDIVAASVEPFTEVNVLAVALDWLVSAPGPFEVFTGSWSLIDV